MKVEFVDAITLMEINMLLNNMYPLLYSRHMISYNITTAFIILVV